MDTAKDRDDNRTDIGMPDSGVVPESMDTAEDNSTSEPDREISPNVVMPGSQTKAQSLDELLKEGGDHYNSLKALLTDIKRFESNQYENFPELARSFAANYSNYIKSSPLAEEPKTLEFAKDFNILLNGQGSDSKKKEYMQKIIDYLNGPISAEYNKISTFLKPGDYHNIVRGSLNDPLIMLNPFMQSMKNELGKNEDYGRGIKLNDLAKTMAEDYRKNDFSKLGDYFEKIPYNKKALMKAGLNETQVETMIKTQDDLFKKMTSGLKEEYQKPLMRSLLGILISEGSKQVSKLDPSSSMSAVKNSNLDPLTGAYLALNAKDYGEKADSISGTYSPRMGLGMEYGMEE